MYLHIQNGLGLGPLFTALLSSITFQPVRPPSYPLAVRNPYLSTWMPSDQVQNLPYADSQFWGGQNLTWSVLARVDGRAYSLMGVKDHGDGIIRPAVVRSAEYTATHSLFTLSAGEAVIILDFFSPISPSNYLRQSLPFSYLTVSVSEESAKSVQILSSIDGRWTGSAENTSRNFQQTGSTAVYSLTVEHAAPYSEVSDMATWGEVIFASRPSATSKLSSSSGKWEDVESTFAKTGFLINDDDPWVSEGVLALSHDLGTVTKEQSVNFAVGYVRENAINYLGKAYTGYYRAQYPDTNQAVSHFLDDYEDALQESSTLDSEMARKAKVAAGQKYADIVTLSARQAYGGVDLTIPSDTLDTEDALGFIKELSSNGNLNTVDVIMPAFPVYYILNPDYIRILLEPMMRYLAAGRWKEPYVIHDMGTHYPNATGHNDQKAEPMPIEECGNLMVLAYAYVSASGDEAWKKQYMSTLRKYADYLVEHGVDIAEQLSSNDAAGPLANETNLAIKAAVGLKAFGKLTGLTEYSRIGDERASLFFTQGLGTDERKSHFVLQYPEHENSWKVPYNLYPDILFGLHTFPNAAYEMGSAFFKTVRAEYGVTLDHRHDWAKSDWNMWLAGTLDTGTRDEFVDDLWAFMTNGKHNWPFSDRYVATSAKGQHPGLPILCRGRPTVGGHFALMALEGPRSLHNDVVRSLEALKDMGEAQDLVEQHGEDL